MPSVRLAAALVLLVLSGCAALRGGERSATPSAPKGQGAAGGVATSDLQALVARAKGGGIVRLPAGDYVIDPVAFEDETCGNCEDAAQSVPATRGLLVTGRGVHLVGVGAAEVTLRTRAGYGVLFQDCEDCSLEGVTVTGGIRDVDARATSAAVVARRSRVRLAGTTLRDNIGDPKVVAHLVVGIAGLALREGADLTVEGCRILGNSWDGIAVYRGGKAEIRDTVVDGVETSRGDHVGGGRGVGIGVTWDGVALVERCLVTRYWKGIGAFVNARVTARDSIIEDVLTWGVSNWDAGKGAPVLRLEGCVVYRTGACGILVSRHRSLDGLDAGALVGNAVIATGQNATLDSPTAYCRQVAIDLDAVPGGFVAEGNLLYANREAGGASGASDVTDEVFARDVATIAGRLGPHPALAGSKFLRDFGP